MKIHMPNNEMFQLLYIDQEIPVVKKFNILKLLNIIIIANSNASWKA